MMNKVMLSFAFALNTLENPALAATTCNNVAREDADNVDNVDKLTMLTMLRMLTMFTMIAISCGTVEAI